MKRDTTNSIYTSRIIKAGALLADTKTLLAHWDDAQSVSQNLDRFRRENIFGKASRSRIEDMLMIFRQRYLTSESVVHALATLVNARWPAPSLDRILYFHAAQADRLLHDMVTEVLLPAHRQGGADISIDNIHAAIARWVGESKTAGRWSEYTVRRVAQGLMATLRDFGVLEGVVHKRLAPMYLPVESFAYIAFYLSRRQQSGERLIKDPEWRLFFLSPQAVERFFIEAHQRHLLEYHAAGPVVRIEFPARTLEAYAYVIVERAH